MLADEPPHHLGTAAVLEHFHAHARRRSSSPRNVTFSPTTTRGMRYSRIAPEHMAHGDKVVYKTLRAYTPAGRRPAFSKASISPWSIALPYCTRRLCPRPMICPSWTRTEQIAMPPSASSTAASETALSRNSSIAPPRQHAASPGRPQPFRVLNRHPMPPNAAVDLRAPDRAEGEERCSVRSSGLLGSV